MKRSIEIHYRYHINRAAGCRCVDGRHNNGIKNNEQNPNLGIPGYFGALVILFKPIIASRCQFSRTNFARVPPDSE